MVEGVEKWDNRKWWGDEKNGRIDKLLIFVWLGVEKWRDGKSEFV